MKAELVYDAKAELAEGPIWYANRLWWVSILSGQLHCLDVSTGINQTRVLGDFVGAAAPTQDGRWLVARRDDIIALDWNSGKSELLCKLDFGPRNLRFNDGKCDPTGRFYVGTLSLDGEANAGAFYRVDRDGCVTEVLSRVTISNGLAWSADATRLYYIDSPTQRVDLLDVDIPSGNVSNRRPFVEIPSAQGTPDGMAMDVDGNLWVALWGGHAVHCYDGRSGMQLHRVEVPAAQVTSCCFGGADLDRLYITTAKEGLDQAAIEKHPHSGSLFRCDVGVRGVPPDPFH
ncbi:SMP-30/gluconolactonase/LRE family protein [Novipirellula artificiosorum]|uniref:L-arabinolactonase n=1 Tax=Novipirellula artificiosorum TaxID=2528016 RepID=A0A5C6DKG0_9BACT|nr:SMP-30/gluconolactonase/LRE family protein [Novipirellula artificiosorum]TWU37248.1 L-arabinolactonase [Novipirellula artificiosorum]